MPSKIDRLKTAAREAHRLDLIDKAGLKSLTDGRASKADVEMAKSVVANVENWVASLPARRKSSKTTELKRDVASELLKATKAVHSDQARRRGGTTTSASGTGATPRVSTSSGKGTPSTSSGKGTTPSPSPSSSTGSSSSWNGGSTGSVPTSRK